MLLTTNAKLDKSSRAAAAYLLRGLTLAPHGLSGHNVCPGSSVGCRASCNLWFAGQRVSPQARNAAVRDTRWFFRDPETFKEELHRDIIRVQRSAYRKGLTPLIRLNMASDLDWTSVIAAHPDIQFFDYTKIRSRFRAYLAGTLPANYRLTFSRHEKHSETEIAGFLREGGNVAQVFDVLYNPQWKKFGALPETVEIDGESFPVIDGDVHDVRLPEVDGTGVIVGLRLKGTNAAKSRARKSQFATAPEEVYA